MAPPSYEEAMSTNTSTSDSLDGLNSYCSTNNSSTYSNNSTNLSYSELGSILENLKAEVNAQSVELIYSCNNACLYLISNSGRVTTSSGPDTVRVFEITGKKCTICIVSFLLLCFLRAIPSISHIIVNYYSKLRLPTIESIVESR